MNNILKSKMNLIYLILITALCFMFITIDFKTNYDSSVLKLILVITVFLYVLILALKNIIKRNDYKINILYILAITFTLISDYLLLIVDNYYHLALTTFIIAHLSYSFIIYLSDSNFNKKRLIIEKSLILLISLIILIIMKDTLLFLSTIYALSLIMNLVDSVILVIKIKTYYAILLMIGFVLFVGCDICVLLSNLYQIVDETKHILDIEILAECIIWIFYGPSQFFLSLSINRGIKYEKENN